MIWNSEIIFTKILHGYLLRPYPCSRLDTTAEMTPILYVKRRLKLENSLFFRLSCAIVHHIFGDPEFRADIYKNLHGIPLGPYLWSQLVNTSKTTHFQGQTSPKQANPPFFNFCVLKSTFFFGDLKFQDDFPQKFT